MRKNYKKYVAVLAGGLLLLPTALNRLIFMLSNRKSAAVLEGDYFQSSMGDMYYKVRGSGRPLLLLHGGHPGASMEDFGEMAENLSHTYQVYTLDLAGFGQSERKKIDYTAYNYALLLNEFLEQVIKRPCAVCALAESAGFVLTADKMKKGNIKRLFLINPTGILAQEIPTNEDSKARRLLELPVIGTSLCTYALRQKQLKQQAQDTLFFDLQRIPPEFVTRAYRNAHHGGVNARFAYAAYAARYMNTDFKRVFEAVGVKTMVAWGEQVPNAQEKREALLQLRPDIGALVFEKTRLMPQLENAELLQKELLAFLK